jgi:HSP20 family protein
MARSNLTRFNPISDVAPLGFGPNIEDLFREFSLTPALRALEQAPRMRIDVEEADQAYILRAEVPGATREDVTVSIDGNTVSIRADVADERVDQKRHMIRTERVYGEEFRTFTFPQEIDESRAEAAIDNGVLILTLPKKTGSRGTKLNVQDRSATGSSQAQSASASMQGQAASSSMQGQSASGSPQSQSASGSTQGQSSSGSSQGKST